MKRLTLISIIALSFVGYIVISGYKEGPAFFNGYDCTGAETGLGNPTGCGIGGSCHSTSATAGISVTLELDSAGFPVTHYIGGNSYKVKISGTNNTGSNLPNFGFQIGSIKGSAPKVTPTNAGSWPGPYPANVHYAAPQASFFVVGVVEHGVALPATTGTGGTGSTYVETVNWTAPGTGTGTISIWAALNAVNNNGVQDNGDLWNIAHIVINEEPMGIDELNAANNVKVYPNPFTSKAIFSLGTEVEKASLTLYDITGKEMKQLTFSGREVMMERENLLSGIYFYRIITTNNDVMTGKLIIQ
jgi:hypothetical protein